MWKTNTMPNINEYPSWNLKMFHKAISSPLQRRLELANHLLIHMIHPAIMKITWHLKAWLKWHQDEAIMQHIYWEPQRCIWIHPLNHRTTRHKLIQISKIRTLTQWIFAVHFGYRISLTGGTSKKESTHSTPISQMWHMTYSLLYHMVSEWRPVAHFGETLLAGDSQYPLARHFGQMS